MTTVNYTSLLGLALPVTGQLSGSWGNTVNDNITQYLDAAVAGAQTISGSQTAVTLSTTTASALSQAGSGSTGSAQYAIINCTGNPGSLLTITAPAASKFYLILNNTSTSQSVKIVGAGPTTGVTIASATNALVAWNGSDFELVASSTGGTVTSVGGTGTVNGITLTGTVTSSGNLTLGGTLSGVDLTSQVTGTLPTANGGTGLTTFTAANNALYSTSSSALTAGTLPVAAGGTGATTLTANNVILGNGTSAVQFVAPGTTGNVLTSNGTTWTSAAAAASLTGVTQSVSPFETALGFDAGLNNTGVDGTFIGYYAGRAYTSGISNTAVGTRSGVTGTTGSYNTTVGAYSQGSSTGQLNCAFGWNSLNSSTSAYENAAYGARTIQQITTGFQNTALGYQAMRFTDTGSLNTAVGYSAGQNIGSGTQNTTVGASAGATISTGSNNTVIGYNADVSSSAVSNEITLGNSSIATLRCQVTTITSLSDARDKTNISDLSAGLTFVNALRPVAFDWNMRDGGKVGQADTGFIAQDLQLAQESTGVNIPGLVYANNPDRLEAGYGKLIPVLVKAIQELSAEVERLKAQGAK